MTAIHKNDTIVFLRREFHGNDSKEASYIPSDTIIAIKKKHLKVNLPPVPKWKYQYGYCLMDLYGKKHYTPFKEYDIE